MLRYQEKTAVLESTLELFDVDEIKRDARIKKSEERAQKFADPNDTASRRGNWFFWTLLAACILTAVVFYVNGKIQLSETNRENAVAQVRLDEAKRENSRLKTQLEGMATPAIIEEYAEQAGLIREQVSQVTHISVNIESVIEVAPAAERDFLGAVGTWFGNMLEFLGFR